MSMSILAMTGSAEIERAVPKKSENVSRSDPGENPKNSGQV